LRDRYGESVAELGPVEQADQEGGPSAAPVVAGSKWPVWRRRFKRWWAPGRYVLGIVLGALALVALNGQRGELTGATFLIGRVHTGWLLLAICLEAVSLACFAGMQGYLLRCGGVRVGRWRILCITVAAGAIASSLPAGPAVSSVFAYHQYRRRGADDALAIWTLIATLTCAALALALLTTAGVLIAEQQGASLDLIGVTIGVLIVSVAAWLIVAERKYVVALAEWAIRVCQRLTGRPHRHSAELIQGVLGRLEHVRLDFRDLVVAMAWAVGNWAFDCGCLALCFVAVGAGVPWRGLLLAYGAAQLAANLPITPGGLGVVEGSLTIALVAYGGIELTTVAAVLLYRIISFWGFLPVGWAGWGILTWHNRKVDHRKKEALAAQETVEASVPQAPLEQAGTGPTPKDGPAASAAPGTGDGKNPEMERSPA
jgi:uncharacterized protein (TIRG00374 family)